MRLPSRQRRRSAAAARAAGVVTRLTRLTRVTRVTTAAVVAMALVQTACVNAAQAAPPPPVPGTVVSAAPLDRRLWIPETTARAFVLKYVTTDPFGRRAHSTGTMFIPHGKAPADGWPVISWAHGTSGLGDSCAPSKVGPTLPERDRAYLGTWMKQGYAVVASDYVGLGTPGLMPYLDGETTAHSIVDMVKAGRSYAGRHLPVHQRLARKWVTIGQSQGGGAAIAAARHATRFGGRSLDYRGAVGTGTPAYIELLLTPLAPGFPPFALSSGLTEYVSYIFASLRYVHPELGIDGILTATGRKYLKLAETLCSAEFSKRLEGVELGDYFTKPVLTLPGFLSTLRSYMGMPEDGFDKPFFMGHGQSDTDVPYITTAAYAAVLKHNDEPVTFRTYPTDHSGTMAASLRDTVPFVRGLFAR